MPVDLDRRFSRYQEFNNIENFKEANDGRPVPYPTIRFF
jgi:hypothetical protein